MTEPSSSAPREVLIVKPSSLGDIVHTLPCAAILRQSWPHARIRWVVNTEWMPLLQGNPDIDEVIEFPRRQLRGATAIVRIAGWARRLRSRVRPDLVLDFQGLLRSALISRLVKTRHTKVLGLSDAREGSRWFYDLIVDVTGQAHAVDRYLALTRTAAPGAESQTLDWKLPAGESPAGLPEGEKFVLLHPFSRGAGKSLRSEEVEEFCRGMAPSKVVIVGVTSEGPTSASSNVIDLSNATTLTQLIWVLRRASFTVSVDSGPMHIAAALTHRLVSIHTWSDPAKVGPYRGEAFVWKDGKLFTQADRDNPSGWRNVQNITELADFVKTQL